MTYKTQPGTAPHRAVEYLRTKPKGYQASAAELAEFMDLEAKQISPLMEHARLHGWLAATPHPSDKRRVMWSLGDGVPPVAHDYEPDTPIPASWKPAYFNASSWVDGRLILTGLRVRKDGTAILSPKDVAKVRRAVESMPA